MKNQRRMMKHRKLWLFSLGFQLTIGLISCQGKKESKPDKDPAGQAQGKDHVIVVGGPAIGLVFSPPTVEANIGDTVTFEFQPKAHTVTQSFFDDPCKLAARDQSKGFDSGLTPVKNSTKPSDLPRWTLKIQVTTPIYFHCAASHHCGAGMVGAINPPKEGEETFAKFQERAQKAGKKAGGRLGDKGVEAGTLQKGEFIATGELGSPGNSTKKDSAANSAAKSSGSNKLFQNPTFSIFKLFLLVWMIFYVFSINV